MYNIWLDDVRPAPKGWVWAKNVGSCFFYLELHQGCVDVLSLDHDLGTESTGTELAQLMEMHPELFPRRIYLHTSNPVGRANMYQILRHTIQVHKLSTRLFHGPQAYSWEESMTLAKEKGFF